MSKLTVFADGFLSAFDMFPQKTDCQVQFIKAVTTSACKPYSITAVQKDSIRSVVDLQRGCLNTLASKENHSRLNKQYVK